MVGNIVGLVVEFVVTMIFTMVVSITGGDATKVAVVLAGLIILGSGFGVGHVNPAVTLSQFLGGNVNMMRMLSLIAMQMGGAVLGHFLLQLKN